MIRILGTVFAGLLGLAFGSFLNVCLSRWPAGESVVSPRSHCRHCTHTLAWWENIPLLSWFALRGRCRSCDAWIGWRYPLVEVAVGALWAINTWKFFSAIHLIDSPWLALPMLVVCFLGPFTFLWLLVALAALDVENLWLPDKLILPGILGGVLVDAFYRYFFEGTINGQVTFTNFVFHSMQHFWQGRFLEILAAAGLILLIRWLYWLIRRREGIGLGDVKLMALLAAWLGLPGALLACWRCPGGGRRPRLARNPRRANRHGNLGAQKDAAGHLPLHRRHRQRSVGPAHHPRLSALGRFLIALKGFVASYPSQRTRRMGHPDCLG
jgi:leader peptidase (prepilin peptidase)/N-methyltransferase